MEVLFDELEMVFCSLARSLQTTLGSNEHCQLTFGTLSNGKRRGAGLRCAEAGQSSSERLQRTGASEAVAFESGIENERWVFKDIDAVQCAVHDLHPRNELRLISTTTRTASEINLGMAVVSDCPACLCLFTVVGV